MPIASTYYFQDKVLREEELQIPALNRAFLYGDSLFETILIRDGALAFGHQHLQRLVSGMHVLKFIFEEKQLLLLIKDAVEKLLAATAKPGFARMRVQIFRGGRGRFAPETNFPEFFIELLPLLEDPWSESAAISLGLSTGPEICHNSLSSVKSTNCLPYILGAICAQEGGWDEAVLRSTTGEIAECTTSNIFVRRNGALLSPRLESGCLPGIIREIVFGTASALGIPASEERIDQKDLEDAEEVFVTNSVHGLRLVARFLERDFPLRADSIVPKLREHILKTLV